MQRKLTCGQRDEGWKVSPYGCIGRWLFLDCVLVRLPQYETVLERIKAGDVFLDAGCAFGVELRQLAADGAPGSNLIGTDIEQDFLDLGYKLFKDRDTFAARFIAGDLLNAESHSIDAINGQVDIIHASRLFHLFGWDDQVKLGVRLVAFFNPEADALIVGTQVGNMEPLDRAAHAEQGLGWYRHNAETWQQLWDEIGDKTGTKWKAAAVMQEIATSTMGERGPRAIISFAVTRAG